jgi:hypothetical protein
LKVAYLKLERSGRRQWSGAVQKQARQKSSKYEVKNAAVLLFLHLLKLAGQVAKLFYDFFSVSLGKLVG